MQLLRNHHICILSIRYILFYIKNCLFYVKKVYKITIHLRFICVAITKDYKGEKAMGDELKTELLANMVDYRKELVVSKSIIDKETGSVTLFAFDQGEGLSEHTAPFDALVQVLDGEVEIKISGTPYNLKQGEIIIMPANKPHALKAVKRFKMLLTMIRS